MNDDLKSLAAREATREIPPPTEGKGDVWADLIALRREGPLRDAMVARRAMGIERYGRPLRYGDGRGRVDALQEALDLAAYSWRDGDVDGACIALGLAERILGGMI